MFIRLLFALIFLVAIDAQATKIVRVSLIAYDHGSQEWQILLTHRNHQNIWNDFSGRRFPSEEVWESAQRVLSSQTCGAFRLNLAALPYTVRCNPYTHNEEYIYFVPIKYVPVHEIESKALNGSRNGFVWVPASHVMGICEGDYLTIPFRDKKVDVAWGFVSMFQCAWPCFEKDYSSYPDIGIVRHYPDYPLISDAPKKVIPRLSWYCIPGAYSFFRKGTAFYEFTCAYHSSFVVDGKKWPSVEHYMQAMKYPGQPEIQESIRMLPSSHAAYEAGMGMNAEIQGKCREDWDKVCVPAMLIALRAKFRDNPCLRWLLCKTGDTVLVYDTQTSNKIDNLWGAGRNGEGRNILGQMLMQVRYELKHPHPSPDIFVEQPVACFSNGRYFAPAKLLDFHPSR